MHIEIDRTGKIPMLRFRDRDSYARNKTKKYDDIAMKYLTYVLFLLTADFAACSLMYERHKSWYSWILSSLISCVYMFGFIMMCPQLFINYKLKSVAYLPWRQMTYKFLNTIIDELFVLEECLHHIVTLFSSPSSSTFCYLLLTDSTLKPFEQHNLLLIQPSIRSAQPHTQTAFPSCSPPHKPNRDTPSSASCSHKHFSTPFPFCFIIGPYNTVHEGRIYQMKLSTEGRTN